MFDGIQPLQRVMEKAHAIVAAVKKSNKVLENIIFAGKKLVSDSPTEWSSI